MAKPVRVLGLKGLGGRENSLILRNHVAAPAINGPRQGMFVSFKIGDRNVAQGVDCRKKWLQRLYPRFAIGAAKIVFSRGQFMSHHAVRYHQAKILRNRKQLILEGTAIEQ